MAELESHSTLVDHGLKAETGIPLLDEYSMRGTVMCRTDQNDSSPSKVMACINRYNID